VSVDSAGAEADRGSVFPSISADGRFVVFDSDATNLVAGDTNERDGAPVDDVFVHDRHTSVTTRVSIATDGTLGDDGTPQGDDDSGDAAISADGRLVAFESSATDLVAGDSNSVIDVFVHDRELGTTRRVSVATGGTQSDGASADPAISGDGRFVAFRSEAANLVMNDTNLATDVFVHDLQTGITERVSVDSVGAEGDGGTGFRLSISGDGRFVAFPRARRTSCQTTRTAPATSSFTIARRA
jgi:Tol biopolymer transport system component